MEPKIIVPLGISGSGKGTQAKLLSDKLGLKQIVTGELLRARKKEADFSGIKIGRTMNSGRFVPSVLIAKILMDELEQLKHQENFSGFVLDGAPRKLLQAQFLDEAFEWYEWDKYVQVLLIDISEEEATARLTRRRTCVDCKKIISYIGEFKTRQMCDACGGKLETRADDTPDAIRGRMAEYREHVAPVIDYYEKQGRLIRINGEQSIQDVHRDIMKVMK